MTYPHVTLGGLPIDLHAGAPQQSYNPEGGMTDTRLSSGQLVRMIHWQRETITISGQGWMGAGLDALDYTQPLELRCTAPKNATSPSNVIQLPDTVAIRPDVPPWGHALVGRSWVPTPATLSGTTGVCVPVPGASTYRFSWMPVFMVLCRPPAEALDAGQGNASWSFTAQQI